MSPSKDILTLDRILALLDLNPIVSSGQGISIEVMDGSRSNHHLKVISVIQKIAPGALVQYSNIVDPVNHCKTLDNATVRLAEILSRSEFPDIINNSWVFPRTPTNTEYQQHKDLVDFDYHQRTYDQERVLYPCHLKHPYTVLVREAVRKGIVMVYAAGNRGLERGPDLFHGRICGANGLPEVLTVGAMDEYGNPRPWSSYGPSTFAAQKPDVWAMSNYWINDELGFFGGTSSAAPIITGLLAATM